ncbi:hypothetical protein ACFLS9_02740 [Bacteroidota bacterium]
MATKQRHSITLSPSVWNILKLLKKTQGKSISEILEISVRELVKKEGYNKTYFKIMATAKPVNDKENKELTKLLDSLNEDDLEIVEKYKL